MTTRSCAERGGRRVRVLPVRWLLVAAAALSACDVRERPLPSEPASDAQLTVEVLAPRDGATIVAGRTLTVRVRGRDLDGAGVAGLGFVVRRIGAGAGTIDSVAIDLGAPAADATEDFTFAVPAALATNTHLDVFGLAFGTGSAVRVSVPRAVVVARCEPSQNCD